MNDRNRLAVKYFDKLPERAYVANTTGCKGPYGIPPLIAINRGELGYYPIYTSCTADTMNENNGVTPEQASAMHNGSLFGWDTEASDPDNSINHKVSMLLIDTQPVSAPDRVRVGTHHYTDIGMATRAYGDRTEDALAEGRIAVGRPTLKPGDKLLVDVKGRYHIETKGPGDGN